jgi:hypothetical protein
MAFGGIGRSFAKQARLSAKYRKRLYDFQVFRNRLAMVYAIAYLRLPRIRGGDYGASAVAVSRRLSWAPGLAS